MRWTALILATLCAPVAAQSVPTATLTKPDAQFGEPFSSLIGLRELPNGRVLISDRLEKTVALLDFASGDMTTIGREGQGPGEYGMPAQLFPMGGDTTLLLDFAALRGLLITGNGVGKTVSLATGQGLPFIPRAADAKGMLYSGNVMMVRGPGGAASTNADSIPITRLDPASGVVDTVAWIGQPRAGHGVDLRGGSGGSFQVRAGMQPYAAQNGWAVAPDGRIAIVRAEPYRVEWIANGRRTTGPTLPFTPVNVGSAEKDEWADQVAGQPMMIRTIGGTGGATTRPIKPERPNVDEIDWPSHKPPFESQGVFLTPEGELWIRTSQPAGAKRQRYDVVNAQGLLVRRVELADDRRLLGFGKGTLYTVRRDADDLEWLERFRR